MMLTTFKVNQGQNRHASPTRRHTAMRKPNKKLEKTAYPKRTSPSPMALRIHYHLAPVPLQLIPIFHTNPLPAYFSSAHFVNASPRHPIAISCTNNNNSGFSDSELALKFATEVEKLKAPMAQREEALNKSRELLFEELSNYMGLKAEEAKGKWRTMNDDDKLAVIKGFVSEWSDNFHPLSAKSAKELVDEYLADERKSSGDSGPPLFPSLRKLIGF